MTTQTTIQFITEEPAEQDEFGAHGRVANALCAVLLDSQKTKSIGILGNWGSGKSTIIDLVSRQLKKRDGVGRFEFFIYDAWLHQNDQTRRSLLEELSTFLTLAGISDVENICDLESLTGEKIEQENLSKPVLSPISILFAFCLILVPVGLVLMRSTDTVDLIGSSVYAVKTIGHIFLSLPALLFAGMFILSRPHLKVWTSEFWSEYNNRFNFSGVAGLLISKSPDRVIVTTRKKSEPTANEFHAAFQRLITAASEQHISVIVVVDNLDRVDAEQAMEMWSIMRSFFEQGEDNQAPSLIAGPRLVLPFDTKSLIRLYGKDGQVDSSAVDRAQAFIEKTFDVVFQLGPPVSSDWEVYLGKRLSRAFGEYATTDRCFAAYRIYSHIFDPLGTGLGITPRRINAFVNRIVALRLQWGEAVNFSSLAYYAAVNQPGNFEIRMVLSPESPAAPLMNEMYGDWRRDIAVLHYGVTEDKAFQVLVGPEIDLCFRDRNGGTKFAELVKIPGFETALRTFLDTKLSADQPPPDPAYILNAADSVANHLSESLGVRGIWRPIASSLARLAPWKLLPVSHGVGLGGLLAHDKDAQLHLVRSLQSVEDGSPMIAPAAWLDQLGAIVAAGDDPRVWQALSVPGSAGNYLSVIALQCSRTSGRERPRLFRSLTPVADQAEVEAQLIQNIEDKTSSQVTLGQIRGLAKVDLQWRWDDVVKSLVLQFRSATDPIAAITSVEGLLALYRVADPSLVELRTEGYTADLFARAVSAKNIHAVAVSLAMITEVAGEIDHTAELGQSVLGQTQLESLDDTIKPFFDEVVSEYITLCTQNNPQAHYLEAETIPFLARVSKRHEKWRKFAAAAIGRLVGGAGTWARGHPKLIFEESDTYADLLSSATFRGLLDRAATFESFPASTANIPDASFWAIAHEPVTSPTLKTWVNEQARARLASLTSEAWLDLFANQARLVGRMIRTKAKVSQADFGDKFADNAGVWWKGFLEEGDRRLRAETVTDLLRRLKKSKREVMLKTALDQLLATRPETWDPEFVSRILPALAEFGVLTGDVDRFARTLVLAPLTSGSSAVKRSLLMLNKSLSRVVKAADESTREEITDQLKRLQSEEKALSYWVVGAEAAWTLEQDAKSKR